MPRSFSFLCCSLLAVAIISSCSVNPYAATNKSYKKQAKAYARTLSEVPQENQEGVTYPQGDYWVGATNFNMRKPNFVIIHHTAQNSTEHTLKTFTTPATSVSAHYVIGRDGKVYHMLNDYLRAWHAGVGKWGNNTDINSSSIGIELDNNGAEPFSEEQVNSLLGVLAMLKKKYDIPTANFIGHSDIAPTRKNDPNPAFPWRKMAENGYGLWYDQNVLDSVMVAKTYPVTDSTILKSGIQDSLVVFEQVPLHPVPEYFNPEEALRIIGYDTRNLNAAIKAFKLHFIQENVNAILTENDKRILYNLYKKYL
ncbi:N-acetylmuramoyl-L-alanine amidase [Pontibacter sp. MBLB2868]|uniref:N-acetylmuramoyl-L-alanine amidase n=1 Tax=Pontibacter sp. MBLB2868 TaxID=3451555 RepID=UPI003F74BAA1